MGRNWKQLADESDARAAGLGIDPPRPGRKTYEERERKTEAMSTAEIITMITEREAEDKECGVAYRVLANRQARGEL